MRRGYARKEGVEARARRGRPVSKFRLVQDTGPQLPPELRGHSDRGQA
ncbi:MAG: hypothetical protein WC421_02950 [Elusimicrobiales bacterium]